MTETQFFGERQPAAVLKHAILERYLPMFVRKVGSRSPNGRVAYVDGFAGPGLYDDGSPGSPAVAVDTALAIVGKDGERRVDGYLVEENPKSVTALRSFISDEGLDWTVYAGDVEEHLSTILTTLPVAEPAFMFLDPFGLGVPKAMLDQILARSGQFKFGYRTSGAATEILLNFSLPGLRRNCGHLESPKTDPTYLKARAKILDRLDSTLGGDWWRDMWVNGDPGDRESKIFKQYMASFVGDGWSTVSVPCADRWEGPPSYVLLLLTQHPDGVWLFHEAVSNAMEVYRNHCEKLTGDYDLFSDPKIRAEMWIDQIAKNITKLLEQYPVFEVQRQMRAVYGPTLTFAREKHVKQAVKNLYAAGVTSTNGVGGKVQTMRVKRA